jgi:uncharacterized protein DUF3467
MSEQQPEELPQACETTRTTPLHELPIRKSVDFTTIYANNVHFATLPWDLTLIFGQAMTADPNDLHIEHRLAVTLSPQTAKVVAAFLTKNVLTYEQQYGEIHTSLPQSTEESSA